MSRIGKQPVAVPDNVKVSLDRQSHMITIEGPKGSLSYEYATQVDVSWDESEKQIVCSLPAQRLGIRTMRAYWGTVRARISNMILGVTNGFTRQLEIIGVGWNAQAQGKKLRLNVGYCHPIDMTPPDGVEFAIAGNVVTITGPDKQAVGQFSADIRSKRPPEPYNGKGIKYVGEQIIRKQGKVFGS
jgi:large subunit ribosomal protein L6